MIGALLALALGAVDPCASVSAHAGSDPATASVYRETGDAEAARGASDTAAIAYARAASLDAGDTRSRAALARLCRDRAASTDPFEVGRRRMDAGDLRGAAEAFHEGRAAGDCSAALLEGVCLYRLGDDARAEAALREAEQADEHRELARFYQGLLALRGGEASRAAELFDSAASNPSLATMAGTMSRLASRDGRLVLSLSLGLGADSNVALLPKGSSSTTGGGMMGGGTGPAAMTNGDGLYDVGAAALWRPEGPVGPYLRAGGAMHRYFDQTAYDVATFEGGGGWQVAKGGSGALGELSYRDQRFGSAPYLQAGRATGSGWLSTGNVTWSASWSGALQRYASDFDAFSGFIQRLEGKGAWVFGPQAWLALAYGATWDAARSGIAAYTDQGPRLELRGVLANRWRAGLDLAYTWRTYNDFDPTLGVRQTASFLDGSAFVEVDLANRWTARLSLDGRNATSNVAATEYAKLVPMFGLTYVYGM
jgi:tetratricopeptide (TPR) repeat protein